VRGIVATLALLLAVPAVAAAEEPKPERFEVTVGGRVVATTGYTSWNFKASSGSPSVLSELTWRGVDSVVNEVHAEAVWKRLVLHGALGVGAIQEGVFIDNDYAADDRQGRFSATRSDVTGNALVYVQIDAGLRLLTWKQLAAHVPGYLDAFVGYQFWSEDYEASGAKGTSTLSDDRVAVQETFRFHSIRVGAQAQVPLYRGLALRVGGAYLPWTRSEMEDEHPQRTDLHQDPSFSADAEGGMGYQLEAGLIYRLRRPRLSIEAGYRYWRINSGEGAEFAHTLAGTVRSRLNEIVIERYGPWVGVTYRF
jgi:hypothetical protein